MNKQYTAFIILILVLVGGWFLLGKGKKLEAPTDSTKTDTMPEEGKMDDMKAATIPSDFNASVEVSTAPVKEFVVTGKNFAFSPNTMTVKKGDMVKITFKNSEGFHDFRIDEFKAATKQIKTGEEQTISFLADKTGSFQYYCSVGSHRAMGMWGTLTVQ